MYRRISESDGGQILLTIPEELQGRPVEIYVLPIEEFSEKQKRKEHKKEHKDD